MVPSTNRLGLLLTAGALTAQAAIAADIPVARRSRPPATSIVTASGESARYAHADLLFASFHTGDDTAAAFSNFADGTHGRRAPLGEDLGYSSKWSRAGVTLAYGKFEPGSRIAAGGTTAKAGGIAASFNGYFDLGPWYGLTPFAGADAGHRYLNLGDASPAAEFASATALTNPAAHEVRVGVRWNFDDVRIR